MKTFLNTIAKFIAVTIAFGVSGYLLWNNIVVQELGIGKLINSIRPFGVMFILISALSALRKDIDVLVYIKYTVNWWTIILTYLCILLVYLICI